MDKNQESNSGSFPPLTKSRSCLVILTTAFLFQEIKSLLISCIASNQEKREKKGELLNCFCSYSFNPPPLMAANRHMPDSPGFPTVGILYHGDNGFPRFSAHDGGTPTLTLPPGINHPINICSCSHGLLVFHDPISNIYYIGNPQYPDSYIPLPQTPRQHDPQHTHVVLATEILEPPIYHLICAVEDLTPTTYTFDTYSSSIGRWLSYNGLDVRGHIIPNTGVSHDAYACWLTESPRSIFWFDIYFPFVGRQLFTDDVIPFVPETRIQIGRIGNEVVLLSVSVEGSPNFVVNMCFIQDDNPPQWCRFSSELPIPTRTWSIPRPIRFQSNYIEVFFWANGRLMIWSNAGQTGFLYMLNEEGVRAADGIAFIFSTLRPQNFPVTFQQND